MKKSIVIISAILLVCVLAISGCASGSPAASISPSAATAVSQSAAASVAASASPTASQPAQSGTITDMLGNQVTIKSTDKIVSIAPSTTEILYALGVGDKIVGVDAYSDYPAEAKTKTIVGDFNGPSVEKIVALKPDVVFCGNTLQKDQIVQMQKLGLTVVATEAVSFDDISKSIELMGSIMGKQDAAKAIVDKINAAVAGAKQKTPKTQKSVYYVMSFGDAGNWTSGPGSFINSIIETCGGVPVTKDAKDVWLDFPMESLVKADPNIILFASDSGKLEDLKKAQGYSGLTAVKNGAVYTVDASILSRPGPRIADAITMVSDLLNK
jgi:iron complex transport system substrate-binding protein